MTEDWEALKIEADRLGCRDIIDTLSELSEMFYKLHEQKKELDGICIERLKLIIKLEQEAE